MGVVVGRSWDVGVIFFCMGLGLLGFRCFVLRPACGFLQWAQSPVFAVWAVYGFRGLRGLGVRGFGGRGFKFKSRVKRSGRKVARFVTSGCKVWIKVQWCGLCSACKESSPSAVRRMLLYLHNLKP